MKKVLLLPLFLFLCCLSLSAQLDLPSCDTINLAELGQCFLPEIELTNSAVSDGSCMNDSVFWYVHVDLWNDGVVDYEYSSEIDPTDNDPTDDTNQNGIYDVYLAPTFSNEDVTILISDSLQLSAFTHMVYWKAMDACGNEIQCISGFKIQDDQAPILECVEEDYIVYTTDDANDIELNLDRIILSAIDNCSPSDSLVFTVGDNPDSPSLAFSVITDDIALELNVFDQVGNVSSCVVNIDFIALPFPNLASVENVFGSPMSDVEIIIETQDPFDNSDLIFNYFTNNNGEFIAFVSSDFDYSIQAEFDDNCTGLSTRDMLLIQDYINDKNSFSNPFDIIACDANNDFLVELNDIDYVRSLLFGEVVDASLWKFIYSRIEFDDENDPFPYEEGIVHIAESDWKWKDLIGVKLGDVDHSALEEPISLDTLQLTAANVIVEEDEEIEVDFFIPVGTDVRGFQLALDHEMEFLGIQSGSLDISDVDISSSNSTLLITCINGTIVSEAPAFTLRFRSKKYNELRHLIRALHPLSLIGGKLPAEVYVGDDFETNYLQFSMEGEVEYDTKSFQIIPNPFFDEAIINFELSQTAQVNFQVFDTSGRLVSEYDVGEFNKGKNAISISRGDFIFLHSGVYFLTFKIVYSDSNLGTETFTNKIVLQESR